MNRQGATQAHDIETDEDVADLVRVFYERAMADPIIGFMFTDVARIDLSEHLPRINRFWSTVLLGAKTYRGGAFRAHAALNAKAPLQRGHFDRWLTLWCAAVDERFVGPRAELAKAHARRTARGFRGRLAALPAAGGDPLPGGGIPVIQRYPGVGAIGDPGRPQRPGG